MSTPHVHAELIKAWADGATIQRLYPNEQWLNTESPCWYPNQQYRIKPEPKPDIVGLMRIDPADAKQCVAYATNVIDSNYISWANVKCTFDGETHKLKSIELID